jgi:murein DD-endopeptidase MepM/ murein hydrolase activator NlpD
MELRYIAYSRGNFLSRQPAARPAATQAEIARADKPKTPSPAATIAAAGTVKAVPAPPAPGPPAAASPVRPAPALRIAPAATAPATRIAPSPAPLLETLSPRPASMPAGPVSPAPKTAVPPAPCAVEPVAPAPVAAAPVVADNFDLVSVDEVHFDADQPIGPPVDVRDLFTSNEIPGAVLVADGAAIAAVAPKAPASSAAPAAAPPPAAARPEPTPAELTAQAVARLAERRAREAARHAEREAERRARKEAAAAARRTREEADKARENTEKAAKLAQRHARQAAREALRRQRAAARARKRAEAASRREAANRLPVAPRPAPSPAALRRRAIAANAASALGLVAAIGLSIFYFAGEAGRAGPAARDTAASALVTPANAAVPIPAKRGLALPRPPQAALLSLAAIENEVERRSFQTVVRVQRGEYFRDLLMRSGVNGAEAQLASISLAGVYDVRKMKAGQLVTIDFGILGEEHNRFLGVRFDSNFDRAVKIQRQSRGDFVATEIKKEIVTQILRTNGTIDHSVFQAGLQAGLPPEPVVRMINLFAYDVDFQRDVQKGDSFEALIEQHRDQRGDVVRHGNILFASMMLQGQTIKLYRWQGDDGEVDYFSETGHSSKKALMRTPIDGARLSSGFGYRRHPVLGYSKMHQGTDFAAPSGTPIYAAGSGQIERIGWAGGYGNSITIRHNREYATLYGHMSGFAPGMSLGKRVKQGDIVGFVGSTGLSTGPHLHYEVHLMNKPIDPLSLKLPSRQRLQGKELARYLDHVKSIDARFRALARNGATGTNLATASDQEADTGCVNGVRLDPTDKRACE